MIMGSTAIVTGCKKGLESFNHVAKDYKTIGIVEMSVDTTFSTWDEKAGLIPKFPRKPGDPVLTLEEQQFLHNTGKEILEEISKNPKFKIVGKIIPVEGQVGGRIMYSTAFGQGFTPQIVREICEQNQLDAIVFINAGYYLYRQYGFFSDIADGARSFKKIGSGNFNPDANVGGLFMRIEIYDNHYKKILSEKVFSVSEKTKTFEVSGHTFHLTEGVKSVAEEGKRSMLAAIRNVIVDSKK